MKLIRSSLGAKVPSAAWVILLMMMIFRVISARYLTLQNIINIIQQNSILLILAVGATLVLLSEGIDLSAGAVLTLSGVTCARVMKGLMESGSSNETAMIAGVSVGLLTGTLMGGTTGALIAIGKLPPFIASLGMMGVGGSLSLVLAESTAIYVNNPVFLFFGQTLDKFVHMPIARYLSMPTFIAVSVFCVVWLMLYHSPFGRYIIAIGGNEQGTRLSGVNVTFWKWMVYVTAGVLSAISGITLAARLEAADSIVGIGWEFDAIAAAILGGTSFAKGKGGIAGTVLGVLVIGVARNGLNVSGIPSLWQPALMGSIVILAIVFEIIHSRWREGVR
jgi:ribose transport system permease protein